MIRKSVLILTLLICFNSCNKTDDSASDTNFEILSDEESENFKSILNGRGFRQFTPDIDANPRKGIQISFIKYDNHIIQVLGLYNKEENILINLWRVNGENFEVYKSKNEIYKIKFTGISSEQELPEGCQDCLNVKTFIFFIKNPFDENLIEFKLEKNEQLPNPYPVFLDWTKFKEDQYYH